VDTCDAGGNDDRNPCTMTASGTDAYPAVAWGSAARGLSRWRISRALARERATDVLWIIFIVGASSAARPLKIENVERYFWLPADLTVLVLLLPSLRLFAGYALQHKIFLAWPALACLSMLWSLSPWLSLYHGLQLLMTIMVAFLFCMHADRLKALQLIFLALLCCQVLSLFAVVAMPSWAIGHIGEWKGVFPHKNVLGSMMAVQIITGTCLFLHGWQRTLTGAAVACAVALLLLSRSGTSLVTIAVALSLLPLAICLRQGRAALSIAVGLLSILAAGGLLCIHLGDLDLFKLMLSGVGKDQTLTGRTVLWNFGIEAFLTRPWLGHGFKGYWESTQTTAHYLRHVIGHDLWFFHNNFLEVAVAFGVAGPVLLVAGLCTALSRTLRAFLADRQFTTLWSLQFVLYMAIFSLVESPLFENHSLYQFLLIVAVAAQTPGLQGRRPVRTATGAARLGIRGHS
jgi:exopolysaccharide production protein ExoQ